ncbi:MAG: flagellin [Fibrobacteria bacterium]|nr:flagellin [Fibrobacteria bacterium]
MTRINHNISAMITQSTLNRTNRGLSKSLERLSTGLRVNRASDDAAGLSISEQLRTQVRGTHVAIRNANDGIALLRIAEGAANEVSAMLQRMRELALQSSNATLTSTERGYNDQEVQALMREIHRISLQTQYNGMTLLDGTPDSFGVSGGPNSVLHIGANNNKGQVSGTVDTMKVTLDSLTIGALGLTLSETGEPTVTSTTTQAGAFATITQVDNALRSINNMRSDIGAYMNRLEHAVNNLEIQHTNMQSAESTIRDADFAFETTQFTRDQILMQAGTAMLGQANQIPTSVLSLLQ